MINSDYHTLADFVELSDEEIFAKTRRSLEFIDDYKKKGYYTYQRVLLTPCKNRVTVFDPQLGGPSGR